MDIIIRFPGFYRYAPVRILLVKTSSLGDVIHNLPMVSDLAQHFPDSEIDWLVEESFADIPRLHAAVGQVIPVAVRRWRKALFQATTWREIKQFRQQLRQTSYDFVIDSQGLLKSSLLTWLSHGRKVGYDRASIREPAASLAYDQTVAVEKSQHAVQRNRLLAATALGYKLSGPPNYGISAPTLQTPWLPRGDYAVLLTATSRADKEWPDADWLALGNALIATGLRCVLPAGNESERLHAMSLATSLGRAIAAPPLTLRELAGLMAGAKLVIGVDTGLTHLAVALDRPTVAIYCASTPALTGVLSGSDAAAINLGSAGLSPKAGEVLAQALAILD